MCGRYALALRPSEVRQQLEQSHMPVDHSPDDDAARQSYNFAPGYHGLVYRADGPDYGNSGQEHDDKTGKDNATSSDLVQGHAGTRYKLQAMKWGLIPFWTKRNPDYGSMIKTINCRDDSLIEDRGMWTSMKKKKRCIVVAQGFYEWLKKNNGKEKIPHFTKRADGQLMCFAGLWDVVRYEDSDEKIFSYSIITTNSNKQLNFLHDRMPVILDNGSEAIRTWLDPDRTEWSSELQSLLEPFKGRLECYPVSKDVGKVGNNSPSFLVPVNSSANKQNIANFFSNQGNAARAKRDEGTIVKREHESPGATAEKVRIEHDINETGATTDHTAGIDEKAPLPAPMPKTPKIGNDLRGIKRERGEGQDDGDTTDGAPTQKRKMSAISSQSPQSKTGKSAIKKGMTRSATNNGSAKGSPLKGEGNRKITSFFGK